jgi:DMSO/TMAO reductase YedYZ molybdopterin-dependent catalytic subunit
MNVMEPTVANPARTEAVAPREVRLAGLLATGVTVAFLYVVSGLGIGIPFPPTSIAEALLRAIPGDLATFFIENLGHWARPSLAVGAVLATLFVGSEALARTDRNGDGPKPLIAGMLLAGLAALAIAVGPHDEVSVGAVVFGLLLAVALYSFVARRCLRSFFEATGSGDVDEGRRRALRLGVGGALGMALAGLGVGWLARRVGGPDTDVTLVAASDPAKMPVRKDFPEIPGLSPEVTASADHYVVDINLVQPSVEAAGWTLKVDGLVDKPLTLDFNELQKRFPIVEEYAVLTCISNEIGGDLVGNSVWGGVRMKDLLDEAGVQEGAVDVVLYAADHYSDSIPIDMARDPSVLLAVSQNGSPLRREHGFPCRVRIPQIYGMKNVKWLERIEVVSTDYQGYWMQRGWSDEALIRTESRIDVPSGGSALPVGEDTWIAGVAWSGGRGISKVEVSTDGGGTWAEAMLKEPLSPYAWTQWAYRWTPAAAGSVTIACRATDGKGEVQTPNIAPPHPSGATGFHFRDVTVG